MAVFSCGGFWLFCFKFSSNLQSNFMIIDFTIKYSWKCMSLLKLISQIEPFEQLEQHLCQSHFLNKFAGLRSAPMNFENTFLQSTSGLLLLQKIFYKILPNTPRRIYVYVYIYIYIYIYIYKIYIYIIYIYIIYI